MDQNIIVYIIIASAVVYSIFAVVKSLTSKKKSSCDGCTGCDVKHEISKNHITIKNKNKCSM